MKKAECEDAIRKLCWEWRQAEKLDAAPSEKLSFLAFYKWLQDNYPSYLRFRTTTSVRFDIELWFDQEFGLVWMR